MAGEGRWMAPRRERGEEDAGKRKKERRGNLDILETLLVALIKLGGCLNCLGALNNSVGHFVPLPFHFIIFFLGF